MGEWPELKAEPTVTVYSYYAPEIAHVVQETLAEQNFGRRGDPGIHSLLRSNVAPGLDDLHLPLLRKYERFARSEGVIGLDTFDHKYYTAGSSDGIFHLMAGLLPNQQFYQFEGEYQGYQAYADSIGRSIITVKDTAELMQQKPGILVVSNPGSRDGRRIPGVLMKEWGKRHLILLDLAYMGMTQEPLNLDLTDDSIIAVVGSLSKPFGLYYYRIGFCYSKFSIPSLYGSTMWFKNALSIKIGEAVLDAWTERKAQAFKDKYFVLQTEAIKRVTSFMRAPQGWIKPSDTWLLAYAEVPTGTWGGPGHQAFKRSEDYLRFCLTPYFLEK